MEHNIYCLYHIKIPIQILRMLLIGWWSPWDGKSKRPGGREKPWSYDRNRVLEYKVQELGKPAWAIDK